MSRNRLAVRTATVVAALIAPMLLAAPGSQAAPAPAPEAALAKGASHARISFAVETCEGCKMRLSDAARDYHGTWQSRQKRVEDGVVSWRVPARHASDLSASIVAPWEKRTGYVTQVVFHYRGDQRGDHVSIKHARKQKHGSLCFAGPGDDAISVALTVRKVKVDGASPRPVDGTLAFATTSRTFVAPYTRTYHGVGGAQEVPLCGPAA